MASIDGTRFTAWIATESAGDPICLGGADGGLSITAYADEEDRIKGVIVADEGETVASIGWIPAVVMEEEIKYERDHVV